MRNSRTLKPFLALLIIAWLASTAAHAQIAFRAASSAASGGSAITFVAAGAQTVGTGASITPAIPAGAAANDLAVVIIAGRPSDASEPAAPAGWTLRSSRLLEVGANDLRIMTFYRLLAGGESNPVINLPTGWQGTTAGMSGQIAVWRGVDGVNPFDVADVTGAALTGDGGDNPDEWTPPSVTTLTSGAWVVSALATSDDNALSFAFPRGFTSRMMGAAYDTITGGDHSVGLADKLQATPGAATMLTWDTDLNAPDPWVGITFALRLGQAALTIAKPTGTAANDVMLAAIGVQPHTGTITAPAGWTLVRRADNSASTANSLAVYRKTATASEPASYSWALGGAVTAYAGGIQSFAGVDTTTPIDVENGAPTPSALTHASPSVTTTLANTMVVTFHSFSSSQSWIPPTGMTEAFDVTSATPPSSAGQSLEGNYVLQAAAGATGTKSASVSANADAGNAQILALRPINTVAQMYFIHVDQLNTPRLVADAAGTTVWRWDQAEPFGNNVPDENPSGLGAFDLPLRLPGQYFDKETNLQYNYFRDYDPSIGRYVESDPVGIDGGLNTYAYVAADPLTGIDPEGLFRWSPGLGNLLRPAESPAAGPRPTPTPPQLQPIDPAAPIPSPVTQPLGKGRYYCKIRCDGVEITGYWASVSQSSSLICAGNSGNCPPHIHGEGYGSSPAEAWNNAWDSANNATPRGCYKRHCRGIAGSCKNWKGGKR